MKSELIDKMIKHLSIVAGVIYIYQGLVTKMWFKPFDTMQMIYSLGVGETYANAVCFALGLCQCVFGVGLIQGSKEKFMHYLNIAFVAISCLVVLTVFPSRLIDTFNPIVMYIALFGLSTIALQLIPAREQP